MCGPHYWSGPGLDTFHVRFHYLGAQARTPHHVVLQYYPFSRITGFNTYLGRADGQDVVSSVVVYLRQGRGHVEYMVGPPPPPRPTTPALVDDVVEGEGWTITPLGDSGFV